MGSTEITDEQKFKSLLIFRTLSELAFHQIDFLKTFDFYVNKITHGLKQFHDILAKEVKKTYTSEFVQEQAQEAYFIGGSCVNDFVEIMKIIDLEGLVDLGKDIHNLREKYEALYLKKENKN